jgi:FtsH-binding integral membrane protein
MTKNNIIALILITIGGLVGTIMSFFLPADKLSTALPIPSAIIGAGLTLWNGQNNNGNQ